MCCPVPRELHGQEPAATSDVDAALLRPYVFPIEVFPQQQAPLGRYEDTWVDVNLREVQREQRQTARIYPGLGDRLGDRSRIGIPGGKRARTPSAGLCAR